MTVFFKAVQKPNKFLSQQQKRPVFEEKFHIVKMVPGDKDLVIDRPLREERDGQLGDRELFPDAWQRFLRNRENKIPGMPIEMWHSINDTQKAEFRAMNIFTIEQFANLPDAMAGKIMGFHELRKKALVFVDSGKDAEARAEADRKNAALEARLKEMEAMIEQLTRPKSEVVTV